MSLFSGLLGGGSSRPKQTPKPTRPDILDNNNFVKDQFRISNHSSPFEQMGSDAMNLLFNRATAEGPSQSAQYLMDQNNALANKANSAAINQSAGQFQNLVNNQAMRGGMDRGSRLRALNKMGNTNLNAIHQNNINRNNNQLDILQKDEASKFALLGQMPGKSLQYANHDLDKAKFDITNSLNTANNFYNQDMSQWAALNSANQARWAAKNTGGLFGSGGFLGTGL